jgi:aspartate kinase
MKILKFGGTSVGSPQRMREVARIIQNNERKIVVLSAVSGTTNALVNLSKHLHDKNHDTFYTELKKLKESYFSFIEELLTAAEQHKQGLEIVEAHFEQIAAFAKDIFTVHEERAILAQGELMSTALFYLYCKQENLNAALIPALEFMRINHEGEPDDYYIKVNLERILESNKHVDYLITQGFICRNVYGEIDNLKRGGSDYSASIIGAAIQADEIQIWTDIDGMHNNDPRIISNTRPITQLSFDEAAELAYFGAKILHPSSIRPAKDKNIPVLLKNTMQPEAEGTKISLVSITRSIKAVAAKDNITAIKIKSGRMLMAYGFLRSIFEVFEWYKTSIDMVTTSEVAVSLTIDDHSHLAEIVADLSKFGIVEVDTDQTIVCVVGDFLAEKSGMGAQIFTALKDIPLRMVSYGGSKNNVSFLIQSSFKNQALQALNDHLFEL